MPDAIEQAGMIAKEGHKGQRYGTLPYVTHPLRVARIVAKYSDDVDTISAALLHDILEDTNFTVRDLSLSGINNRVIHMVTLLTKFKDKREFEPYIGVWPEEIWKFARLIEADTPTKLVKLADRLDNISHAKAFGPKKAERYAQETILLLDEIGNAEPSISVIIKSKAEEVLKWAQTEKDQ